MQTFELLQGYLIKVVRNDDENECAHPADCKASTLPAGEINRAEHRALMLPRLKLVKNSIVPPCAQIQNPLPGCTRFVGSQEVRKMQPKPFDGEFS